MAYKDFSTDLPDLVAALPVTAPVAPAGQFTALEWTTIALARRDSLSSLREPGRVARAMGGLFGRSTQSRLADPMLETLRRLLAGSTTLVLGSRAFMPIPACPKPQVSAVT